MRHALVLLACCGTSGTSAAYNIGNTKRDYSYHATRLRADLLANYDKAVAPNSTRVSGYSAAGTDVYFQMRFFRVEAVEPANGELKMKVWWRLSWEDLRLSWDPSEYPYVEEIKFFAGDLNPEVAEIWLPDITAYNSATGTMHSFEPAMASVRSDGSVFWSRAGTLHVMCRFSGLVQFPYDQLSCPIQIGGWQTSGLTQGLLPATSGCLSTTAAEEEVAQVSYAEYSIVDQTCSTFDLEYASYPGELWPMILIRVYFDRAPKFYSFFALVPSFALTLVSFSVFFMGLHVGERLGVGVTLVLLIEVAKVAMSEMIPVCGELIWMDLFTFLNFVFTLASLLESCVVLSLSAQDDERLLPAVLDPSVWTVAFRTSAIRDFLTGSTSKAKKATEKVRAEVQAAASDVSSTLSALAAKTAAQTASRDPAAMPQWDDSPAAERGGDDEGSGSAETPRGVNISAPFTPRPNGSSDKKAAREDVLSQEDVTKIIFFENLFFRLDVDGSDTINFDEMRRLLAFTALDMTSAEVDAALIAADNEDGDGELNRHEFIGMCINILFHYPLSQLEAAATNFADFRLARGRRLNAKWQRVAKQVDMWSRFWFPTLYLLSMIMLFSVQLGDKYEGLNNSTRTRRQRQSQLQGQEGVYQEQTRFLGAITIDDASVSRLIVIPVVTAVVVVLLVFCFTYILLPAKRRQERFVAQQEGGTETLRLYARKHTQQLERQKSKGASALKGATSMLQRISSTPRISTRRGGAPASVEAPAPAPAAATRTTAALEAE